MSIEIEIGLGLLRIGRRENDYRVEVEIRRWWLYFHLPFVGSLFLATFETQWSPWSEIRMPKEERQALRQAMEAREAQGQL